MKNRISMLLGLLVCFMLFVGENISYAYTLDDIKRDYPKVKIEKETTQNDAGKTDTYRKMRLMKLPTDNSGLKLEFWLYEKNNYLKYVNVYATWYGDYWCFWNRITVGDGTNSYDIYPDWKPVREVDGRHVCEQLSFSIHDINKFNLWNNAIQIRIKGDEYYNTFYMPEVNAYKTDMNIIKRFLFE